MTRMPHRTLLWTANLLVPGTGLVLLGRLVLGVLLGVWWGLTLSGFVLATLVWPDGAGPIVAVLLAASAAAAYVLAQFLCYVRVRAAARHLESDRRDEMFKEALVATLQGRLDDAEAICKSLLRLDTDDVEATLHLGTLARHGGRREVAFRYLRRARYLDDAGRWDFEIGRELAALNEPQSAATK